MIRELLTAAALSTLVLAWQAIDSHAQPPSLDPASIQCVSCHEAYYSPGPPPALCHGEDCGHPVGVPYADLAAKNPVLQKPDKLNGAVKLVNGAIGCTTCHVPYVDDNEHAAKSQARTGSPPAPDPMLVIDNAGSALCTACHRV